jgi:excinuclease UvrABC nuclease subunit
VHDTPDIFQRHLCFDPCTDFDSFLHQVPAQWVVYLFADADDRPVQLLCVKNLRYSLKRRLGGAETVGPSKRVNYRDLVRRIHYRPVYSAFEADWVYLEAARRIFPESYQGMVGFQPAWFVHVDPDAAFPRYTKTTDLSDRPGVFVGPVEDKHAAARLMQLAEDTFDLCRYYNILLESPGGKACAYKEMGKCPAPCDGSISMDEYRAMVRRSVETVISPAEFLAEQTRLMQQAAQLLQFEEAKKIKQRIDEVSQLGRGPFRHVRLLREFEFVCVQPGPRAGTAKVFLVTCSEIEEAAAIIEVSADHSELIAHMRDRARAHDERPMTTAATEGVGLVARHLFSPKKLRGQFVPLDALDGPTLRQACEALKKPDLPEEVETEGVTKELNAL